MVDLTPGAVAVVTLPALIVPGDGRPDVTVQVTCSRSPDAWVDLSNRDFVYADADVVGAPRHLTVLDLTPVPGMPQAPIAQWIRNGGYNYVANQIEAQLPPVRPDEPGRYGVVTASCAHSQARHEWYHGVDGWIVTDTDTDTVPHQWTELDAPTVVREGT